MTVDHERVVKMVDRVLNEFKEKVIEIIMKDDSHNNVIEFINSYKSSFITPEEYIKRRRVKNPIPFHEKCLAKAANGEQCSRRKKKGGDFCGTHSKACPHGIVSTDNIQETSKECNVIKKQIEVWLEDIHGIMYWINDSGVVYHPDDIKKNIENPRVIAHYEKIEVDGNDVFKIIEEMN